jgi:choline dehydrogenase-like flavoprotein
LSCSDQGEDFVTIPGLAGGAIGTKYDWNMTYSPNPNLANRSVPIPQGKIVGGGTKLNRMVFDRGSKSDFDRWAALGNPGWDYDGLFPYFKKVGT